MIWELISVILGNLTYLQPLGWESLSCWSLLHITLIKYLQNSHSFPLQLISVKCCQKMVSWSLRMAYITDGGSLMAQRVNNLPAMQETRVWFLCQEDPLEKGMVTHSSILAWRIPWTEEPVGYRPWGHKESDMTEWLTLYSTDKSWIFTISFYKLQEI